MNTPARHAFFALMVFPIPLICGPSRTLAVEPSGPVQSLDNGSRPFEIPLNGHKIAEVTFRVGTGRIIDPVNGELLVSWTAKSGPAGKYIEWYIHAKRSRRGPDVALSNDILEKIRKIKEKVDRDGSGRLPEKRWEAYVTDNDVTSAPINVVTTSYNWINRHCDENTRLDPLTMKCDSPDLILAPAIEAFRASGFVTSWDIYKPPTQ
jgi:hypothetical protein